MIGSTVKLKNGSIITAVKAEGLYGNSINFVWECSTCSKDTELWPLGSIKSTIYRASKNAPCGCSIRTRYVENQTRVRASRLAKLKGYTFKDWAEGYKGNTTKCHLLCAKHGPWNSTSFASLLEGKGCPKCAQLGFSGFRSLSLYLLESTCGAYLKIGTTRNLSKRLTRLKKHTPFKFQLIGWIESRGYEARAQEKAFINSFDSANFKDFESHSEWLKYDPNIIEKFISLYSSLPTLPQPSATGRQALC